MNKFSLRFILVVSCLLVSESDGWTQDSKGPESVGFTSRMESRQGHAGTPDVIAHRAVSKGDNFECIKVQSHPKEPDDVAACVLKFPGGEKRTLKFMERTQAPSDGVVYLECLGDRPADCTVGVW